MDLHIAEDRHAIKGMCSYNVSEVRIMGVEHAWVIYLYRLFKFSGASSLMVKYLERNMGDMMKNSTGMNLSFFFFNVEVGVPGVWALL